MRKIFKVVFHSCSIFAILLVFTLPLSQLSADDDTSAALIADQFDQAIKDGDTEAVRNILHDDVLIFESGNVEASLEEYASHHLQADISFMSGMQKEVISRNIFQEGDIAVVSTQYKMRGEYKGRLFDKISMETLVLKKSGSDWKIVHVHWS